VLEGVKSSKMKRVALILWLAGLAACATQPPDSSSQSVVPPTIPETIAPAPSGPKPPYTFTFQNFTYGDPEGEPPIPASVFLTIVKQDPVAGEVSWSRIHREGDQLGWSMEAGQVTSVHGVFSRSLGKKANVDFNVGLRLRRIATDQLVPYTSKHCPILETPMSACPGPTEVKMTYRVNEAILDGGSVVCFVVRTNSGPGPEADALCTAHEGEKAPPKWTGEHLKEARAREAALLLFEANNGWTSKNPKVRTRSQETYKKLRDEFSSVEAVKLNGDLIRTRAEATIED
jgi:hypothetical protein